MKLRWPLTLTIASVALGFVFLCVTPFAALAVWTARTLSPRAAYATVLATWAAVQLVGFGWLGYPRDTQSLAWGLAIGLAALAAVAVARRVRHAAAAFAFAFAAYEGVLFAVASATGDVRAFAPAIVGSIFAGNVFGFALLGAARFAWTRGEHAPAHPRAS
jgi:hypothetical protein